MKSIINGTGRKRKNLQIFADLHLWTNLLMFSIFIKNSVKLILALLCDKNALSWCNTATACQAVIQSYLGFFKASFWSSLELKI